MKLNDYKTIRGDANSLLIVNKSKFYGKIIYVDTVDKSNEILADIRKKNHDASHICYAYVIGNNKEQMKYSDDGEPGGTAGIPMLEVLKKNDITNVLAICTRYFGGIKLGGGGLVRAYSSSVSESLKSSQIVKYVPCEIFSVEIAYDIWAKIEKKVRAANTIIRNIDYVESVKIEIGLRALNKEEVFNIINQALKVKDAFKFIESDYVEAYD